MSLNILISNNIEPTIRSQSKHLFIQQDMHMVMLISYISYVKYVLAYPI